MLRRVLCILMLLCLPACAPDASGGGGNGGNSNGGSDNGGNGGQDNNEGGGGGGGGGGGSLPTVPTGELVYFSGRPPPEWIIPESEFADLAQRMEGLTETAKPAEFPRFGPVAYRLVNTTGAEGLPEQALVQDGIVRIKSGSTYTYFTDDKGLEAALEASARSSGAYAELGIVEEEAPE